MLEGCLVCLGVRGEEAIVPYVIDDTVIPPAIEILP